MREHVPALIELAAAADRDGMRDVVVCGMGGSSLAPEVLASVYGSAVSGRRLHVLDTTDPRRIAAVESELELGASLVIVASKSGGTVETDSLRRHFTAQLAAAGLPASRHLIAITDAGSALQQRADDESWRACFVNPSDVGGRYSALSLFGLVPAALIGADIGRLLDAGATEAATCAPGAVSDCVRLGAAMGALVAAGVDRLTIRSSASLGTFGDWVEQLVAESTGKLGPDGPTGILPVVHEPPTSQDASDRFVVSLVMAGETPPVAPGDDVPQACFEIDGPAGLGALFWRFEMATTLASVLLGVEPFDQKDVAAAKAATNAVLASGAASGPADDEGALTAALDATDDDGYVALLSYLPRGRDEDAAVVELADALRDRTGVAVTVGVGPRYLHSTGQLHKGGPANGTFILLEGPDPSGTDADLPVPGRDYTFGRLFSAQAEGDAQTLLARGRKLVRLRTGPDVAADVRAWTNAIDAD